MHILEQIDLGDGWTANVYHDESPESPRRWCNVAAFHCAHRHYDLGDVQHKSAESIERALFDAMGDHLMIAACREYLDWRSYCADMSETLGYVWQIMTDRSEWAASDCAKTVRAWPMNMPRVLGEDWRKQSISDLARALDARGLTECEALPLYLMDHSGLALSTSSFSCPWDSGQVGWAVITKADALKDLGATEADWREKARACIESEVKVYSQYLGGEVYGFKIIRPDGEESGHSCWGFYGMDHDENGLLEAARDMLAEAKADLVSEVAKVFA